MIEKNIEKIIFYNRRLSARKLIFDHENEKIVGEVMTS